ncbi:phage tail protein [Paenibacillus sp. FSL K6-3182]|uniref:phage tail protein n=1 Tax=Paenibacillus sp. FSL K6-3182 TaxID=2921495 RepID=UPI0030D1C6E4
MLSYVADVTELKGVKGYGESEAFEIGDTVHIDEEDLKIEVTARIVEYEEYPLSPERSRVVLANFLPSPTDTLTKMQDTARVVESVTTGGGRISTGWIEGKINTLKNQLVASGAYASAELLLNEGFLLENTDMNSPDYGALYLGPGIFAIASEKVGGNWNWRTFGKGSGFTADVINAGILNANLIRINSETTFDPGYDPSTKQTPSAAQQKANAAKQAAFEAAALDAQNKATAARQAAEAVAAAKALLA